MGLANNLQHEAVRQLVNNDHRTDDLARHTFTSHAEQVVDVDLVLVRWPELGRRHEQELSADPLGRSPVVDAGELYEDRLAKAAHRLDRDGVWLRRAARVAEGY